MHVALDGIRIELVATHIYKRLHLVPQFFICEDVMNAGNLVKILFDTCELVG